ncbi:B3/B4 domain-containing protein [Peptoniphilus stercorisuis]|uniref:DNA/RNA-binding domain of Phe-tRNA-synthetase-like protein n=1 Tax=Peptoniphilus stercorisuis TaxID=1436965 RepID=A0ABS4KCM8_9FIRM|nr:B3/4 domain-containing protein [Peptoniphilus stercorisuis]MBP2025541.1 DNA/RNA-binding domain of Phe-tRNA-synthetase-like protein [Peptoniphilus stercorisuis]
MSKFIADESFFEIFPDAKLGVLLIKNMENGESPNELKDLLLKSNEEAEKFITNPKFSDNEIIREWRDAYKKFKTKKKARCSIEALLKRVEKDNIVGPINALVDIYNSASLKFGLPCGAEDIDSFVGDLRLTLTDGGDEFYAIGSEENEPTKEGELCYKDDQGAVCRCFNWRDGTRTMINDDTKNTFLIMEILNEEKLETLNEALDFISELSEKYLNANVEKHIVDRKNNEINLK